MTAEDPGTSAAPAGAGNRRIDRVLAEDYLDGLAQASLAEVRELRTEAEQERFRLLELPPEALQEPLTLLVEDNAGGKGRPTVFARLEWRGQRMTPAFNRSVVVEELLAQVQAKFDLGSPFGAAE